MVAATLPVKVTTLPPALAAKPVPKMVTVLPMAPRAGAMAETINCGAVTGRLYSFEVPPSGFWTLRIRVAAAAVLAAGMVILSCWLLMKLAGSVVVATQSCNEYETPALVRLSGHLLAGKRAEWRSMD